MSCKSCKYFRAANVLEGAAHGVGKCMRYPPVVVAYKGGIDSAWSAVRINDECGEFAAAIVSIAQEEKLNG